LLEENGEKGRIKTVPWDKDVFFIRVTNCTLLAIACFDGGRHRRRGYIITTRYEISQMVTA